MATILVTSQAFDNNIPNSMAQKWFLYGAFISIHLWQALVAHCGVFNHMLQKVQIFVSLAHYSTSLRQPDITH